MRRAVRRLFATAAAVSAVVAAVTAVIGGRSFVRRDEVWVHQPPGPKLAGGSRGWALNVLSTRGTLGVVLQTRSGTAGPDLQYTSTDNPDDDVRDYMRTRATFALVHVPDLLNVRDKPANVIVVAAGDEWPFAATTVLPVTWVVRRRLTRPLAAGCCRRCGYDLRATPGPCPECGTTP